MIGQVGVLLRVKTLKEKQALRAYQASKAALAAAEAELAAGRQRLADSAAALPGKVDAVYATVMRQVVGQTAVDTVKGRELALEKEHEALAHEVERLAHVEARCRKACEEARTRHAEALKARDKYDMLRERLRAEFQALVEAREEGEVEELTAARYGRAQ